MSEAGFCERCQRHMRTPFCLKCDKKRYNQHYYQLNRERLLAAARAWNAMHRDQTRLYHRRYEKKLAEAR